MTLFKRLTSALALISLLAFTACGGGSGSSGSPPFGGTSPGGTGTGGGTGGGTGTAALALSLSNTTVSSAAPVTVTATATTATGAAAASVVVSFNTTNKLGSFSSTTALTNANGVATVTLSPAAASAAGADTVVATATVGGTAVTASAGFSLVATNATITSFTSVGGATAANPLSAYGQSVLSVGLSGASSAAPVTLSLTSACVSSGKAKISPATTTATSNSVSFTYQDTGGCGSTIPFDTVTASISGASTSQSIQIYLSSPTANNIVFVSASPPTIYLQGTGLTTSSQVTFQVNDAANNPLPGQQVTLGLNTYAGGLSITGNDLTAASDGTPPVVPPQTTDSNGQVTVLVNSGTVPTPVRVTATLGSGVTTVSSNLSVAVGLPSELHFSLAQGSINIEGYNRDATSNTYSVIASDRLGNPVPNGTAINFVAEGGQVQAAAFTTTLGTSGCASSASASSASGSGLSCAVAQFQTSNPRPADGRVTVLAYALGEKSFIDENGDNIFTSADTHQWFQDLGNPYIDTLYNGYFGSSANNQFFAQTPSGTSACNSTPLSALPSNLQLDVSIPSEPYTCSGSWGKAYVRRAVETIFSTSSASPMWGTSTPTGAYAPNASQCGAKTLIVPNAGSTFPAYNASGVPTTATYYAVGATVLFNQAGGSIVFYASDANPIAFNPVAAGSTISFSATSAIALAPPPFGTPVPSTSQPSGAGIGWSFTATDANGNPTGTGTITATITSPSGLGTSIPIVVTSSAPPSGYVACP